MKANEAPEKIYVYIPDDDIVGTASIQKGFPHQFVTDEYVRTDAFIEKTLAYLNEKFYFNNLHYAVENNTFNCMEEMFEDFKKYIKGE